MAILLKAPTNFEKWLINLKKWVKFSNKKKQNSFFCLLAVDIRRKNFSIWFMEIKSQYFVCKVNWKSRSGKKGFGWRWWRLRWTIVWIFCQFWFYCLILLKRFLTMHPATVCFDYFIAVKVCMNGNEYIIKTHSSKQNLNVFPVLIAISTPMGYFEIVTGWKLGSVSSANQFF